MRRRMLREIERSAKCVKVDIDWGCDRIIALIEDQLELLLLGGHQIVDPLPKDSRARVAFSMLLARAFNSSWSSLQLARYGLFGESYSLIRGTLEVVLQMRFLAANPEKIEEWLQGTEFSPREVRKAFPEEEEMTRKVYSRFSAYVHPFARGMDVVLSKRGTTVGSMFAESKLLHRRFMLVAVLLQISLHGIRDILGSSARQQWLTEFERARRATEGLVEGFL